MDALATSKDVTTKYLHVLLTPSEDEESTATLVNCTELIMLLKKFCGDYKTA